MDERKIATSAVLLFADFIFSICKMATGSADLAGLAQSALPFGSLSEMLALPLGPAPGLRFEVVIFAGGVWLLYYHLPELTGVQING